MKDIAVGVDFSDTDNKVLDVIVPIAKQLGATLHLIHVQRALSEWVEYATIAVRHDAEERRQLTAASEANIGKLAERVREADVAFDTTVKEGDPLDELLRVAGEKACDLIVVGSHGRKLIERALLGHVADRVVRKASIPVLVVPTV